MSASDTSLFARIATEMSDPEEMLKAMEAERQARPEVEAPFVAPRTPVEQEVAGIVAAVLGLDQVGVHDGFYELGGSSLAAMQVILRVNEALQVELPPETLATGSFSVQEIVEAIVRCRVEGADLEELAALLEELEGLSDEEAMC